MMNGALVVDKPSGPTSHDVVARARRALGARRVGHTGTLDPLATGVLVLLVGRATRLARFLVTDEKEYVADVRLGIETPTYDAASLPAESSRAFRLQAEAPETNELELALANFRGTFLQTPPPHSAKKVGGTRAYERARRHEPVDLRPVEVTVHALELLSSCQGLLRLRIVCSSGFYVRSLAHDLGRRLGCGAHLESLRRIRAGRFSIDRAVPFTALDHPHAEVTAGLIPLDRLLDHLPGVTLSEVGMTRASHGNAIGPDHVTAGVVPVTPGARVRLLDSDGALVAVADRQGDALLHPFVVLV